MDQPMRENIAAEGLPRIVCIKMISGIFSAAENVFSVEASFEPNISGLLPTGAAWMVVGLSGLSPHMQNVAAKGIIERTIERVSQT